MKARRHERIGSVGLIRLTAWAVCAAVSVTLAVLACMTPSGTQRIDAAMAAWAGPDPHEAQLVARKTDIDRRAMNDALRTLATDRDRLLTRIASLERNLDDITGSIKNQVVARPLPDNTPPLSPPNVDALPAISGDAPAAKPADPEWLANAPRVWPHPSAPLPSPPAAFPETSPAAAAAPAPPVRTSSLEPEPPSTPPSRISRTDFGVDIGSGADLKEVRMLWNAAKAQHGRVIGNLRPIVVRRQDSAGKSDYRLVIGPIPNAAAAAQLCATLGAADIMCSTRPYQGDKLTP